MGVLTSIEGSNPSFSVSERERPRANKVTMSAATLVPARRGGRAVECGGLENRFGPLGPTRVQIPPPPLNQPQSRIRGRTWAFEARQRRRDFVLSDSPLVLSPP